MIERIGHEIWGQQAEVRLPAGMRLPARATIMRLENGTLLLHSPLAIDDDDAREIDALGEVRFIVAPSTLHWMFVEAAARRYPRARILAAPELAKKLGSVSFEPLPERGAIEEIGDALQVERVQGAPSLAEHVFLHRASRSLVVTDLLFNVHACTSLGMRLVLRIMGAWKTTAQSWEWRFITKDRAAAARSAAEILSWDWDRLVVAHGEVVEDDARERVRRALAWMTSGAPRLLAVASSGREVVTRTP